MATLLSTPTATPSQKPESIVFTSGSSIRISAPASKVFSTILDTATYPDWNTTNPSVSFPKATDDTKTLRQPGTLADLAFHMTPTSSALKVPVKILSVTEDGGEGEYKLEWQGQMLPRWFGIAERVQIVRGRGVDECELVQWESMSGWGAAVLNWVLQTQKQMHGVNLRYAEDLKEYMER